VERETDLSPSLGNANVLKETRSFKKKKERKETDRAWGKREMTSRLIHQFSKTKRSRQITKEAKIHRIQEFKNSLISQFLPISSLSPKLMLNALTARGAPTSGVFGINNATL
jgi:hypothetical protein